jgi:glutamyl-tRNA reductase
LNITHTIAFNHNQFTLEQVGKLHLSPDERDASLILIKAELEIEELVYLSTCNRVEFILVCHKKINSKFLEKLLKLVNAEFSAEEIHNYAEKALVYDGEKSIQHLFRVASSLDSFIVGEREIITQVRNAFEDAAKAGLSGDRLRLIARNIIATAKEVYTKTTIAHNPVSVVSLAYRKLKDLQVKKDARFLIIGAGQTNTNLCKYLKKHQYKNFVVFNRTAEKAALLAQSINGKDLPFEDLFSYNEGFDVLISCTSSAHTIVDLKLYEQLLQGDNGSKIAIDLAIPYDIDPLIYKNYKVNAILVESLQQQAEENLASRRSSIDKCEEIIEKNIAIYKEMNRARSIEKAMQSVPLKVKEIRENAVSNVFAKEIETLDDNGKEVLNKMMTYFEKKYISVPMKMAREIFLDQNVS